jgi:hypothetical protein
MSVGKIGRIRPAAGVHVREFDGEMVLLDLERGVYFGLDEIGARVWNGLSTGETPEQIATRLAPEYAAEVDAMIVDFVALADELVRRGLASPA